MSATFDVGSKMAYLTDILAPFTDFLNIECVPHGEFMRDTAKTDRLRECYQKYQLKPAETILVDDRIYDHWLRIHHRPPGGTGVDSRIRGCRSGEGLVAGSVNPLFWSLGSYEPALSHNYSAR